MGTFSRQTAAQADCRLGACFVDWVMVLTTNQLELSNYLQRHDVNIGWCTIFLQTVSKAIPASAMPEDVEDRERHHWWKAKKWAYFNLNRLWIRSANSLRHL